MNKKYFDTRKDSLEDKINTIASEQSSITQPITDTKLAVDRKYFETKPGSLADAAVKIVSEGMDPVNKDAVKKKFDDRKDKDIDNDGDTDSSDKFLHKRRKTISKAMSKDEGNKFGKALKDARENGDKTFVVSGKTYNVEDYNQDENYDVGTPENTKAKLDATPGQSQDDWNQQVETMQQKNISMREALAKMWGIEEKNNKNPFDNVKEKKYNKKEGKTMTGKPETKIEIEPKMEKKK